MSEQAVFGILIWILVAVAVVGLWRRFSRRGILTVDLVAECVDRTNMDSAEVHRLLVDCATHSDNPKTVAAVLATKGRIPTATAHLLRQYVFMQAMAQGYVFGEPGRDLPKPGSSPAA
jgi:hypothetical protein